MGIGTILFLTLFFLFSSCQKEERGVKEAIKKIALIHQGPFTLPIYLFPELLSLSIDQPTYFDSFDRKEAEKELYSLGIFKELSLKKCRSDILAIEYALYRPIYILGDLSNTLVSEKGTLMPNRPYFTPKNIPLLYLGSETIEEHFDFLKKLTALIQEGEIEMIDLRQIAARSKARRELVIKIGQNGASHLLRLDPLYIEEQYNNYLILLQNITKNKQSDLIIDLRFPETAYLSRIFY